MNATGTRFVDFEPLFSNNAIYARRTLCDEAPFASYSLYAESLNDDKKEEL